MQNPQAHRHFIFHKPYSCLSQFIYEGKRKSRKRLIGQFYDFPEGTMAIGRLDENSEGLLLMTTDGKMSQEIRSSRYEKEYYAEVDGIITEEAVKKLEKGVEIGINGEKYLTKECKAHKISFPEHIPMEKRHVRDLRHGPTSWVSITLTEGKYRQVRKMTAIVGFPTLRLIRFRIGKIDLKISSGSSQEVLFFNV